ncbi:PREDICTED: protein preY, mitochondrial, partial [Leptosomus discolor]|uniref:protein preY, mitochondrial n=1 Tax=Leptosomus discolor TaxID=188344 RepID=UPI000522E045
PLTRLARYEEATNELINEELGIAYPVIDGIPNMVPEAARTTGKKPPAEDPKQP